MNKGSRPTFITCNRQKVIDITIATFYAGNFIKDWHVTEEVSFWTAATSDSILRELTVLS